MKDKSQKLPLKKPLMSVEAWEDSIRRSHPEATKAQIAVATFWAILFNVVEEPQQAAQRLSSPAAERSLRL